jgi:hypothetical protein
MLEKVISGCQSGADLAGVTSAKRNGKQTGGWMPKGYRNQFGYFPEYQEMFNVVEHESPDYPPRTEFNVANSDGTIRFAVRWSSAGERLTLRLIKKHKKPHLDVTRKITPEDVVAWIEQNNIRVLNVAGNSERTAPGIGQIVESFLDKVFKLC